MPEWFEWLRLAAQLIGPFLGVVGAIYLYERKIRDDRASMAASQLNQILLQLKTEIETNKRTINQAMDRNRRIPTYQLSDGSEERPTDDERLVYIAPLFANSFSALLANDMSSYVDRRTLNDLYDYYAKIARANWLIERVQRFRYWPSLLEEISNSLREIQQHQDNLLNALPDNSASGGVLNGKK